MTLALFVAIMSIIGATLAGALALAIGFMTGRRLAAGAAVSALAVAGYAALLWPVAMDAARCWGCHSDSGEASSSNGAFLGETAGVLGVIVVACVAAAWSGVVVASWLAARRAARTAAR